MRSAAQAFSEAQDARGGAHLDPASVRPTPTINAPGLPSPSSPPAGPGAVVHRRSGARSSGIARRFFLAGMALNALAAVRAAQYYRRNPNG